MKILQINKYHYIRGGSDSVYFNTSNLLRQKGHTVIHFAMKSPENLPSSQSDFFAENEDFTQKSVLQKITSVPAFFFNSNAENNLTKLILAEKPDVAHLHIFYGSLTSSILKVLKAHNIPTVVSVHDYKFVCPAYLFLDGQNQICEKCNKNSYFNAVANKCVKQSRSFSAIFAFESYYRDIVYPIHRMFNKLIFVSKFSADVHVKHKNELSRIATHLYNFDPALHEKTPNLKKGNYYLYSGRLSKEKGLYTLIKTFNNFPNYHLKVAGTGPELDDLKKLANKNIEFLGFKSGDELRDIISNSSFVIVPSEWYENNPMALIEAYTLGKPVIAADIGGIPEIVLNNETGFIFKSGDVDSLAKQLILAEELSEIDYQDMSKNAVLFSAKNFNPDHHYKELMNIYNSVIEEVEYSNK